MGSNQRMNVGTRRGGGVGGGRNGKMRKGKNKAGGGEYSTGTTHVGLLPSLIDSSPLRF